MRFGVLGPLEVDADGATLSIGTRKRQSVLALLAVNAGRVVGIADLVDELWPDDPPASAVENARGYASGLRRLFEAAEPGRKRLLRQGSGYVLHADQRELDLAAFTADVAAGRDALRRGSPKAAVIHLSDGLALWRGPMVAGLPRGPMLTSRCVAVEEERLAVIEELAEAYLANEQPGEAVSLLRGHVREHPLRERGHLLLIRGLHRVGEAAAALTCYAEARAALAEQLGVEPGPDLQELHRAILNRDPAPGTPPPVVAGHRASGRPRPAPAQLPPDVYGFSGRRDELDRLDDLLTGAGDHATAVVISAIAGTAGVGKTAIAVHWAHRVRHGFPDGQLYVNLRGFDPAGSPATPAEAIRGFLDALGVPAQRIPTDLTAQVGLYRSLLAGRRMLVLLDNARDADHVRPLLPGNPGCLALVTSRNPLTGLVATEGAHPLTLDLLTPDEARDLLTQRLGTDRTAGAPDAVDEIIARCARLPLALAIVAARAATNPRLPLAALADELRNARTKLDALTTGDAITDVRAVFSYSYQQLGAGAARLFRLLGLHPGPDISAAAAASLAGLPAPQVRQLLAELARANLVTEPTAGRYALHDLLRAYAAELAHHADPATERHTAIHRMLDHYLHTAHAAAALLSPQRDPIALVTALPGVAAEKLADLAGALEWFAAEHTVLVALVRQAAAAGFDGHAWRLAWAQASFHQRRGQWHDDVDVQQVALAAAQRLDDRYAEARVRITLGRACTRLGHHDEAATHYRTVATLDDPTGPGNAHIGLAWLLARQRRYEEALDHATKAHEHYRSIGQRAGQADALNAVGWFSTLLGQHDRALTACREAVTIQRELGDRPNEAAAWDSLGYAHHALGQYDQATSCYDRALALFREVGDLYLESATLSNLGTTYAALGDLDAAGGVWRRALEILDDLGHPDGDEIRRKLDDLHRGSARPAAPNDR
ncbi:MAG TPA: BTAD domain-containing putative transcriptional regulator [Pilimelia sp.]|nr:BTAD domain-containing putative transcriptional regulator [Pilimelia sp.]